MKHLKLISIISLFLISMSCTAQTNANESIEEVIHKFSKAGDESDITTIDAILDDNFRIIMNRMFGSKKVGIMPKSGYLKKIKSKEWGGYERATTIENIVINGNLASAKVTHVSKKATMVSLVLLVKAADNEWKLISDAPYFLK